MLWGSTPSDIGNALDVEAMRDDAGVVMALQGGPPTIFGRVPLLIGESAGTARPHLLRISGARKAVVAVTGEATRFS
jgi:hypothetical protein